MSPIVIGTSSWADPGFVAEWYPQDLPERERLPWYAEHFEAVEVNSTFYAVPAPATVAEPPAPAPVVVQPFLPLKVEKVQWARQQAGCKVSKPAKSSRSKESSKACATAKADFLRFPDNPELSALLEKQLVTLAAGDTLTADQAEAAFDIIMAGEATPAQIGALLMAMRLRGETVQEITGAVRAMR